PLANASVTGSAFGYTPTSGSFMADLATEPDTGVSTAFYGTLPGTNGPATSGTILTQTISGTVGAVISVDYNFIAGDDPYDFGIGELLDSSNAVVAQFFLATGGGGTTGWQTATATS